MEYELTEVLPEHLWAEAKNQAIKRSTLKVFKTGAVIFDNKYKIVSKGCSHHRIDAFPSVHAEQHAIEGVQGDAYYKDILIVSVGRANNLAFNSAPCVSCVSRMSAARIRNVFWAERLNDGTLTVNVVGAYELSARVELMNIKKANYAKDMRIKYV